MYVLIYMWKGRIVEIIDGPFNTYKQALKAEKKYEVPCGCGYPDCNRMTSYLEIGTI